mgnify:CR=1 FL=1
MSPMHNTACFFRQQPNSQQELQGLKNGQCYIQGYLSNAQQLSTELKIDSGDEQALLNAAVRQWGSELNRRLCGDYLLIYLSDEQLLLTSSARSSFTAFYSIEGQPNEKQPGLTLATELKQLTDLTQTSLKSSHLLELLAFGPLAGSNTCFEQISQLQAGETLIWQLQQEISLSHQSRLTDAEQLEIARRNKIPAGEVLAPREMDDLDLTKLFNQLPSLAHRLGEPVANAALAHFDSQVKAAGSDTLILDISWLNARNTPAEEGKKNLWCKSILKPALLAQRQKLQQRRQELVSVFKSAQDPHSEFLTFGQWLDLHYLIPAWCQLLQRICQLHGKTLINPFMQPEQLLPLVKKAQPSLPAYFSLQQISLANIYDAMQRLFYTGESGTRDLFDLNPLSTARLLRKTERRRMESLAVQVLTLDYLLRFHPESFAR